MGTKRSFNEAEMDGSPAPGRAPSFTARKRRDDGRGKHKVKEGSIEWAKKRARNIERLFSKNQDLPANVRNDLERELAAHKATINDKAFQKRRSAMISKYHMVRFFERKKASRLVKQLRRKLDQAGDDVDKEALTRELHVAEVDEAYTLYHPHAEPYISLYGASKAEEGGEENNDDTAKASIAQAALNAERPPMWSTIEKTMEDGPDALTRLRERRAPDDSQAAPTSTRRPPKAASTKRDAAAQHPRQSRNPEQASREPATDKQAASNRKTGAKEKPQLNRRERRRLMRETMATKDDSDEDGGFFEEG